jgi:hypothetical protein
MERHENVNELSICVVYRYWRVFLTFLIYHFLKLNKPRILNPMNYYVPKVGKKTEWVN